MAKLVLEGEERQLFMAPVSFQRKGHIVPGATLVLTDRRVVRLTPSRDPRNPLAFLFGGPRMYLEQIRLEEYAGLEVVWDRKHESYFVLRSTGESYLHVAIEVIAPSPAAEWRERFDRWRRGEWPHGAAALPKATLRKKS